MTVWQDYRYEMGLPHLIAGSVSEVELYKVMGMFQWISLAKLIDRRVNRIVGAQGERLYPSFVSVELAFPRGLPADFDEGTQVNVRNGINIYGRRFMEGFSVFDSEPLPEGLCTNIRGKAELLTLDRPWIYMTNAFVARGGTNNRLKVFEPEGMEAAGPAETTALPTGIAEHRAVMASGDLVPFGSEPSVELPVRSSDPVHYPIVLESDINAAWLLYFARYAAIAGYAERIHLGHHLLHPISAALDAALVLERRRIYYFANADAFDAVEARVLMASTIARKSLVQRSDKAVVSEAERILKKYA